MPDAPCYLLVGGSRPIALRNGDVLTVGRDPQNSLCLDDVKASRHHATFSCQGSGQVFVTDQGSTNKTWLNESPLIPKVAVALKNGDRVRIGGKIFSFVLGSEDLEPRQAAARRSQQLAQQDTISEGLLLIDGKVVVQEDKTSPLTTMRVAPLQEPTMQAALSGRLDEQGIPQILQFLHQNQKNGELRIQSSRMSGLVVFEHGQIRHAEAGSIDGVHAIYAMARLSEGAFTFVSKEPLPDYPVNVSQPVMAIVFDCCKRLDEEKK